MHPPQLFSHTQYTIFLVYSTFAYRHRPRHRLSSSPSPIALVIVIVFRSRSAPRHRPRSPVITPDLQSITPDPQLSSSRSPALVLQIPSSRPRFLLSSRVPHSPPSFRVPHSPPSFRVPLSAVVSRSAFRTRVHYQYLHYLGPVLDTHPSATYRCIRAPTKKRLFNVFRYGQSIAVCWTRRFVPPSVHPDPVGSERNTNSVLSTAAHLAF